MKKNFKQLRKKELRTWMSDLGHASYRADQIIAWIYKKHAVSLDIMTNLPQNLRAELKNIAYISDIILLEYTRSSDGTIKFLFQLEDGVIIESVLMPNARGRGLNTLCISSQAGCAMGCSFCDTGKIGLIRHLKAHEIIDQVMAVQRFLKEASLTVLKNRNNESKDISNIVYMGMGEPLHNFDEVMTSLYILTDLMGISKRRITLSTSGIIPGIKMLPEYGPSVNLAVSLNATTDSTRTSLMPVNKKYPLNKLIQACRDYPLPPNRRLTFEYILIKGVNDSRNDAFRLGRLLSGIRSKVNLIPYNSSNTSPDYVRPDDHSIQEFQTILTKAGMIATLRKSTGGDIAAACGQLRANYMIKKRQRSEIKR